MSNHDKLMISVAGIRGVVGTSLTTDAVLKFAAAFGTFAGGGPIVLGRDSRLSGPVMEMAVEAGLRSVGCDVIRIGIVPTPTVQLMTRLLKAKGGIAITASHNPSQWNALKFVSGQGLFLDKGQGEKVIALFHSGRFAYKQYDRLGGSEDYPNAIGDHVAKILKLSFLDIPAIRRKKFKVVTDTCHGAGGPIFSLLLKELGCRAISLHNETSGKFSRPIEPQAKNLKELEKAVVAHQADIGFATDADVDRLSLVSDKGKAIGEEYSLALVARFMFSHFKTQAVTNLSTSRMIDDLAGQFKTSVIRTPVGEANVVGAMKKHQAKIGGEGNGGIIIPELNYARDATAGIALILQMMTEENPPLSRIVEKLPRYHMVKTTLTVKDPERFLIKTRKMFSQCKIDKRDGLKYTWPDAWVHIRASGTEPIVRVIAEAREEKTARGLVRQMIGNDPAPCLP
jgi:phosphomannomutase